MSTNGVKKRVISFDYEIPNNKKEKDDSNNKEEKKTY